MIFNRDALTVVASEIAQTQLNSVSVTFMNLTRREFDPENCSECLILVDLHVLCIRDVSRDQETYVDSMVTYDPVYIKVCIAVELRTHGHILLPLVEVDLTNSFVSECLSVLYSLLHKPSI